MMLRELQKESKMEDETIAEAQRWLNKEVLSFNRFCACCWEKSELYIYPTGYSGLQSKISSVLYQFDNAGPNGAPIMAHLYYMDGN